MASEIRVDKINSLSGVGTVTLSPTGVDIAGITTAATLKVGTGVTASSDGDIFATGVCTASSFSGPVTELTLTNQASDTECFPIFSQAATSNQLPHTNTSLKFNSSTGALTSTSFVGGLPITSGADNRIITASSSSAIQGESNLTYDGNNLSQSIDAAAEGIQITGSGAHYGEIKIDSNRTGANQHLGTFKASWNGTQVARIAFNTGADTTNKDDGRILFSTSSSGGTLSTRLRITETGDIKIGDQTTQVGALRYLDVQNSDSSSASSGAILRLISSNQAQNSTTSVDLAKYRDGAFYINNNETHSGATTVFNIGGSEIARFTTGGLAIGGTGSANTLDDYEEGTCTILIHDAAGSNISVTGGNHKYTKIGNRVFVEGQFTFAESGSKNGGTMVLYQLPFTPAQNNPASGNFWYDATSDAGDVTGIVYPTTSTLAYLKQSTTIGQPSNQKYLTFNEIQANSSRQLFISFSYTTT